MFPGKSWKSIVVALMRLLPPMTVADLGSAMATSVSAGDAGEAGIAVDGSEKMLEVGRDQAARNGIDKVEFLQGDMEELPIESGRWNWHSSRSRCITPCIRRGR